MLRLALLFLVCIAAVAGSTRAAPRDFVYDRELGIVARETLWRAVRGETRIPRTRVKRAYVRCYRTRESFERAFERRTGRAADRVVAYYAGGGDIHLRGQTCANARAFLRGRHTLFTSAALAIVLHESLHRQGLRDERITTCLANDAVRPGALWLGFSDVRAVRARNLAFDYTRRYAPRSYWMGRPDCLALTRKKSWPELVPGPTRSLGVVRPRTTPRRG